MEITNKELIEWLRILDPNVKSNGDTITMSASAMKKLVLDVYEDARRPSTAKK